jgi:hypothetical protein
MDMKQIFSEAVNKAEETKLSITVEPRDINSHGYNGSQAKPVFKGETAENKNLPGTPENKNYSLAIRPLSNNMPQMPGPLAMMQAETKTLSIENSNHTARKTRVMQIKAELFQSELDRSYRDLASTTIRPLVNKPVDVREFPFDCLPAEILDDVNSISNATGWDHVASLIASLGGCAISTWGRYFVRPYDGWEEPVLINLCVVSSSGTMKSHFVKTLKAPLKVCGNEILESFSMTSVEEKVTSDETNRALDRKRRKEIEQLVAACDEDIEAIIQGRQKITEFCATAKERLKIKLVYPPKITLDNVTPKKMIRVMKENGGVGNIFEPELGSLIPGAVKNQDLGVGLLLKGNCMEDFEYDTCRGENQLLQTALNIIYVIQPEAAKVIYQRHHLDDDTGIAPRFDVYFATEPNLLGPDEFDENLLGRYNEKIINRLRRNYTQDQPRNLSCITVTPEAQDHIKVFRETAKKWLTDVSLNHMGSYIRKIHGKAVRWAAVLHCYQHETPESIPISLENMKAGVKIVCHLAHHADYAFRSDGVKAYKLAQRIMVWIKGWRDLEFSSRELHRGLGSKPNMERIMEALRWLERHNVLRLHPKPGGGLQCLIHPQARNF